GGLLAQVCAYVLALVVAPEHAAVTWLAIVGIAASLSGILVIGAVRNGRLSPAATTATWLLLLLPLLGFGAAVLLPAEAIGDPLILGLPRRAAMVLIGVGVLPLLVLPL